MKKLLFILMVCFVGFFAACEKPEDPINGDNNGGNNGDVNPPTQNQLLGTWVMEAEDYTITLVFDEDKWQEIGDDAPLQGTYSLDGDILTMMVGDSLANHVKVIMLYDNNVLVMRYHSEYGDGWGLADEFGLYYRANSTINATVSEIQGKWYWYLRGDSSIIRTSLELKADGTFDLIIPIWRERMLGNYEYRNGRIYFNVTEFQTRENLEEGNESPENLYLNWAEPTEDSWPQEPAFGYAFNRPFIANGGEAFSLLANLPSYFVKQ